jgi:putative ABC transport system permease protein
VKALLRFCVRLFPRAFRIEFGAELADQAMSDYELGRAQGRIAGAKAAVVSIADLVTSALAERWHPTWFGGFRAPQHRTQGERMRGQLEQWLQDLKFGARSLRRSAGFSAVAIGTLALAFGVTAGMFSVVNTVLIQPLPYAHPDRLIHVSGTAPGSDLPPDIGVSAEFLVHYRERAKTIEDVATYNSFTNTARVGDRVERIRMSSPSYSLFSTLGVTPVLGRLPAPSDDGRAAVLSHTMWQTWFAGDKNVLGQTHFLGGENRTIVGVMGPDFRFPSEQTMLWFPDEPTAAEIRLGSFGGLMLARMKSGVTREQVAAELTSLSKELPSRFGGAPTYARVMSQYQAVTTSLREQVLDGSARPLWVLFGGTGIVLLIACANVANLFLVRSEGRHREMAVRQAIGARRGQLLRVQLSEVLIVSGGAAIFAVILARLTLPLFVRFAPPGVPRLADAGVNFETIAFTALLAMVAGLACGILPALRASAPSMLRLRDGGRGMTRGRHWTRNALVVSQTALALVLLVSAGLLLRSHSKMRQVDPGYSTENIFTFQIAPQQPATLTDGPSFANFSLNFMDRIRALPGVESVGLIENVPLDEGTGATRVRTQAGEQGTLLNVTFAGGDYYKTMGIKVLAGRPFTREDAVSSLGNVVISKSAADLLWPGQDPIGRKLQRNGLETWETVVGVVADVKQNNLRDRGQALVYFPMTGQLPTQWRLSSPGYAVKTTRAETIAADIRAIVKEIAPEAPMYRAFTMASLSERVMSGLSFTMLTLGLVSIMALILGAVGLYGVLSYVVAERTREIGVRMALGAQPSGVRRMVVAQGGQVVAIGIAIGLAGAWAASRQLGSLLFEVQPFDPVTFAGMSASMTVVGLIASYIPARRASNVDPIVSLRD